MWPHWLGNTHGWHMSAMCELEYTSRTQFRLLSAHSFILKLHLLFQLNKQTHLLFKFPLLCDYPQIKSLIAKSRTIPIMTDQLSWFAYFQNFTSQPQTTVPRCDCSLTKNIICKIYTLPMIFFKGTFQSSCKTVIDEVEAAVALYNNINPVSVSVGGSSS